MHFLRVKKRSSSTLALNKSGEGYEKSMFRSSSDGLLETPLQHHHRSLLLQFIISCVACFLEWDLNPQNDILSRAQAQAARVISRTRRYNPQGLPFPYPKRLRLVVLNMEPAEGVEPSVVTRRITNALPDRSA